MAQRKALVVGARGVVGSNLIDHLAGDAEREVIGLSRRGGTDRPGVRHVAVDLLDAAATRTIASELADVTHVFYAACQDRPGWSELVTPNVSMLASVLADKQPVWQSLSERHGLRATYEQVSSWAFGDFVFSWDYDMFADTSRSRRFGFHDYVDTFAMFERTFESLRHDRIIP